MAGDGSKSMAKRASHWQAKGQYWVETRRRRCQKALEALRAAADQQPRQLPRYYAPWIEEAIARRDAILMGEARTFTLDEVLETWR